MEAIFALSATEKSFSTYKQTRNHPSKRNIRDFTMSRPTENLSPSNYIIHGGNCGNGGLFFAPPPSLYFSYPPPSPVKYPPPQQNQSQQPPLLPLPVSRPPHNSLPSRSSREFISSPPIARKSNRPRDLSLTPKKSKGEIKRTQSLNGSSTVPLGPDPNDLPKNVPKVLSSLPPSSFKSKVLSSLPPSSFKSMAGNKVKDLDKFSGTVFTPSPHPSCLPLPKFVKPKLSCTAEAAAVDTGATDNLRQLLRLR